MMRMRERANFLIPSCGRALLATALTACLGCGGSGHDPQVAQHENADAAPSRASIAAVPPSPTSRQTRPGPIAELAPPPPPDAEYQSLLRDVVTDSGRVRHEVLEQPDHLAALQRVVQEYGKWVSPPEDKYQLAYWINVYNSNALLKAAKARASGSPDTVQDIPGFFDAADVMVSGQMTSLGELERRISGVGDPRAWAAIVCETRSSPKLRDEPYEASVLERQLNEQCRAWMDDQTHVRATPMGLEISEIFKTHAADFGVDPYHGVAEFIRKFSRPQGIAREYIRKYPGASFAYIPYDWRFNDDQPGPAARNVPLHE